jgi:hypothetical protein
MRAMIRVNSGRTPGFPELMKNAAACLTFRHVLAWWAMQPPGVGVRA